MTKLFGPFNSGAGASMYEAQWSIMMRSVFVDGVLRNYLNELLVYGDSTGMQVKIKSGGGWIKGHYYENDAEEIIAVSAADPTNPRWDYVALEVDCTKSDNQMSVVLIAGTAAVTPNLPALTQTTSKWQIPLAKIVVGSGITTIAAGNVVDIRQIKPEELYNQNLIINGAFTINKRVYASGATLAAGAHGHDKWKAGSGGGNYSFTQLASPTTITIAANKTLIQVIEDRMVDGGTYTLSWEGTCQARCTINSATPSGAYANSPIKVTGQTPGTTMSVEFGNGASVGTLGKVKLELGSVATQYVGRPDGDELRLCQRYCFVPSNPYAYSTIGGGGGLGTTGAYILIYLPTEMRYTPVLSPTPTASDWALSDYGTAIVCTSISVAYSGKNVVTLGIGVAAGITGGKFYYLQNNNSANKVMVLSADL